MGLVETKLRGDKMEKVKRSIANSNIKTEWVEVAATGAGEKNNSGAVVVGAPPSTNNYG